MTPPDDQLPAVIEPTARSALITPTGTYIVPALITDAGGEQAGWRYVEFFAANINNDHTRRAYARACSRFFAWCENRGLSLAAIRPFDVAAWVKELQQKHGAPGVKQQLAAAHAVRLAGDRPGCTDESGGGSARAEACGEDREDAGARWRRMAQAARQHPGAHLARSSRPRPHRHAHLYYSFARIAAALKMKVADLLPRGAGWTVRLHEKGGKEHVMPCHHALAEALHAYINAAGIAEDRKGWLFRTAPRHNADALSDRPMNQYAAWLMIRRRAAAAGITAPIGNHTFRATGITAYLANGGAPEHAQEMAVHESPRATKLYDRTRDRLTQDEVERIRL